MMLAVSVLCQLSLTAQKTVTLQEAINVVKQQDKNSEYLYYYGKVSGVINGACGCHVDASAICSNPWLTSQDSLWVIFVDQKPMCNWEHDCAFVYVPTKVNNLSDVPYFTVKGNRPPRPNIAALTPWGRDGNGVNFISNTPEYVFVSANSYRQHSNSNNDDDPFYRGTEEGNKTYVAMVNCIQSGLNNYVSYYNDMKYLYDVLTQKYGVPYYNFYIFMNGSVTADGEDYYSIPRGSFEYMNEISCGDYPTKKNLIEYLRGQQDIPSECHFLMYFDGHGGYDEIKQHYYVAMMDGDLYDYELKQLLDSIPTKFQTVVMQNCCSGGFVNALKAQGRTIITACGADEESESFFVSPCVNPFKTKNAYNVFSHMWTSALNGERFDFEYDNNWDCIEDSAPRPVNADCDENGRVSLEEAFASAAQNAAAYFQMGIEKGFIKNCDWEHAQYYSSPTTIGEDLSFNHIPDSVTLFVRDNDDDTGKEVNTTTKVYWDSPDIWTSISENLTEAELAGLKQYIEPITSHSQTLYTYVRVSNRGICDYEGHGKYLHVMWSQPALNQTPAVWVGKDSDVLGGLVASVEISQSIPVGEFRIVVVPWQIPDAIYGNETEQISTYSFCLLTHISNSENMEISEISDSTDLAYTPVLQYCDMAQQSFQFFNPDGGRIDANSSIAGFAIMPTVSSKQLTVTVVNDGNDLNTNEGNSEFLLKANNEAGIPTLQIPTSEKQNVMLVRNSKTKSVHTNEIGNIVHVTLTDGSNKLVGGMSIICQETGHENSKKASAGLQIKSIELSSCGIIQVLLSKEAPAKTLLAITPTTVPTLKTEMAVAENVQNATIETGNIPAGPCIVSLIVDGSLIDSKQVIIK